MRKEILKNSFDKDINFDNLEEAKKYYLKSAELFDEFDIYEFEMAV